MVEGVTTARPPDRYRQIDCRPVVDEDEEGDARHARRPSLAFGARCIRGHLFRAGEGRKPDRGEEAEDSPPPQPSYQAHVMSVK